MLDFDLLASQQCHADLNIAVFYNICTFYQFVLMQKCNHYINFLVNKMH